MPMVTMGWSDYRCFVEQQEIELRPVTVVLGRNNAGKSALVRAPLVFSTGVRADSTSPLDLDKLDEQLVDSFESLLYGERPHGSLNFRMTTTDDVNSSSVSCSVRIQNINEYRTQVVSELELESSEHSVQLQWEPNDPPGEENTYTVTVDSRTYHGVAVVFGGIFPQGIETGEKVPEGIAAVIFNLAGFVRKNFDAIRYIGPFRERPARLHRLPARMPNDVGERGENTAGILASDAMRQGRRLIDELNAELGGNLLGWTVDIVERGGGANSVILRSKDDETLEVNLADTGTGIAQALPIFVQRALDVLRPPKKPTLEIIEQPELHLHPAAHAPLADLYLDAAERTNVRFLIETHSETFLLRLRRRIADQTVNPDAVAVYFVESAAGKASARKINIDSNGNLDFWPEGVFSEDYDETRAIVNAQLKRAGSRAN